MHDDAPAWLSAVVTVPTAHVPQVRSALLVRGVASYCIGAGQFTEYWVQVVSLP